jgi:glycine amidinotransferase/scyllo-inosamine-4-phosphate amidinotransferase 1
MLKIHSRNEWDPLKHVVVGRADHANWPVNDPVFASESERTLWKETPVPSGPVPDWIIDEANQDLDALSDTLRSLGAEVSRPEDLNFQTHDGFYNYCPRDRLLVYENTIVDPAMMYPCRDMELQCYRDVVDSADHYLFMPRNEGLVLDAANVLRLNDRMLYLESSSGNAAALNWLRAQFPDTPIESCNFYGGVHIDSTITALRDGLVLLNASRVTPENCPRVFDGWEKIWIDDVVAQDFYQYPYASKWIALNMLVVSPDTVIVDRNQPALIKTLERHKFTVVPQELRHSRTLGGGFHCVTLDLWRKHD